MTCSIFFVLQKFVEKALGIFRIDSQFDRDLAISGDDQSGGMRMVTRRFLRAKFAFVFLQVGTKCRPVLYTQVL